MLVVKVQVPVVCFLKTGKGWGPFSYSKAGQQEDNSQGPEVRAPGGQEGNSIRGLNVQRMESSLGGRGQQG